MKSFSALIIGVSILAAVIVACGVFWNVNTTALKPTGLTIENRYEFIRVNDNNVVLFNKQTGEMWRKFIPSNEGPTNWEKEDLPVEMNNR
ncbi:hypothetical protein [Brevibacillus reuszeri]|uniref:hypothetical protein n=1 Tax=Brevibacillus reuszeri TaxID=54915 RepID=UPI000CCC6DDD|nr:hypothetical protein [Brevibacillus reuszeri]